MKKFILTLSICLLCLFAWNLSEASAITIEVDGVKLQSDTSPEIVNGRTFVPLRVIFEALNAEVKWDDTSKTVYANKEGTKLDIKIGDKKALLNGQKVDMDESAYISNGRTMIPVRFIGENLNYTVNWNNASREVVLTSNDYNQNNEVVGEGITVIVDGKVSDLSNDAKLAMTEYNDEKIVIMPLDKLVKQLNRYAEITYNGNDFVVATNSEIYEGSIGNTALTPQLGQFDYGYADYVELIDGEFYMEAEFIATALRANSYNYDKISNTIIIDTVNKNFDNTKYDIKFSSMEDFTGWLTEWLLINTDNIDNIKILFDFTLDNKNTFKDRSGNNIIEKAIMDSHIFWGGLTPIYKDNNDGFINIELDEDEIKKQEALKVNKKSKELVKGLINENMGDREKVKAINNYIIKNVEPDYEKTGEGGIYGAMFRGKAVCVGYADMFISMAYLSGLEIKSALGSIHGDPHKWVLVNIDGEWLHVDPTWNDSNPPNQYLLKTDEEMRKTHRW